MISLRVFFFVTLTVSGHDYVRADSCNSGAWCSPVNFGYISGDEVDIHINLINIPPKVNFYVLYRQTENCNNHISEHYKQQGSQCDVPEKRGMKDRNIKYKLKLDQKSVRLYIELGISKKVCSTKIILDGISDEHTDKLENTFRTNCLNKSYSPCQIYVDFGSKCEDKINDCTESLESLECKSLDEDLPQDTVHRWYQRYRDGSVIGTIPSSVTGSKSKFIIRFLKFDDNSYIYSETIPIHRKNNWLIEGFKTQVKENKNYVITRKEKYSESKQFNFTCQNIAHTQIGWIDPTGYRITTYNVTFYSRRFTKTDNNSMLCCLHYSTYINYEHEMVVERSVDTITVFIYEEPVKHDNVKDATQHERNNSQGTQVTLSTSFPTTPQTPKTTDITNSRDPEASQSSTPAENHQNKQTERIEQPQTSPNKTEYFIGISSVAGIIILISLIYVVIKKCCRKSSDPEQTLELETYASANMVLYAELDIRPGDTPPPASTEDPTYAEIIGVLRPQSKNAKK